MNEKEFQEMLKIFNRLVELIEKFKGDLKEEDEFVILETPLMIPPEIYDEMCETLDQDSITLFGIT
tara:strand:+ start:294 stop:491 length:198 start_codon:yes stop_codon:yes gene_type:complete